MNVRVRHVALPAAALLLAGCAGMSDQIGLSGGGTSAPAPQASLPERGAESGPAATTAVVESQFTLDGLVLPVTRGQTRTETRSDMQRTDSAVTMDNWLLRKMAGDGRSSTIVRLDRQLTWGLDHAKQSYTECPLTGCATGKPAEDKSDADKPKEPSCPVTVSANDVKVVATGERRVISDFQTERYEVTWALDIQDNQGGRNSNLVRMDLWTTPDSGVVRDVRAIDERFARRYATALSRAEGPFGGYLPARVLGALSTLSNRVDATDRRTAERWAAEMRKVRGYPIQTTLSWTTRGSICGGGAQGGQSSAGGLGAVGSMLGGLFGGNKDQASKQSGGSQSTQAGGERPLITFSQEVKSITVKPVADSAFSPPAGFRRAN